MITLIKLLLKTKLKVENTFALLCQVVLKLKSFKCGTNGIDGNPKLIRNKKLGKTPVN